MFTRMLLIAALSTGAASTLCLTTPANAGHPDNVDMPAHAHWTADQKFAHEAYVGNMMEVQLGELALKQSTNTSVQKFGQRMIDDHGSANKTLGPVLTSLGLTAPTDLPKHKKEMYDKLAKLQGSAFDKSYMDHMVADHKKDVAEYEKATKDSKDESLKAYATKILPIIEGHLKMAQDIHKSLTSGTAREY